MFRYPLLALATLFAQTGQGVGQVQARTESTGPLVVEREVRERWIQGGQNPGFVPFRSSQESIHVPLREARGSSGGRYIDVRSPSWEVSLRLDPRNRLLSLRIDPPALSISGGNRPDQVARGSGISGAFADGSQASGRYPWSFRGSASLPE